MVLTRRTTRDKTAVSAAGTPSKSGKKRAGSKDQRAQLILGDLTAAVGAALLVTPLTMIIDVSVSKAASGQVPMSQALMDGAMEWVESPMSLLSSPAYMLCLFVYVCTYAGANLADATCTLYLRVSPVLPKLLAALMCNMLSCLYKDARLAQIYGGGDSRPFPLSGCVLFVFRDLLANGGGFTFPPLVEPLLAPTLGKARAKTYAQLLVPAAINTLTSPLHLLALSLYTNPEHSPALHVASVAAVYISVTSSRILKGFAAFGLGGVSNNKLRAKFGSG